MIKVIAFDLDDTLWHVDPVIIRAEKTLAKWFHKCVPGFRYNKQEMGKFRDKLLSTEPELAGRLTELRSRMLESALVHQNIFKPKVVAAEAMDIFLNARNDVQFFEGAIDVIAKISCNYELGALTNGNADIYRLGLDEYFSFAFSAEEVGAPKPAPNLFHKALTYTGVQAIEMIYVGDDLVNDIDAANAVGLNTIWLRNKRRAGPAMSEPDSIIENFWQLPKAIGMIESRVSTV